MRTIPTEGTSPQPRERPILFSAPMVRAILDGRKTQTRRIVRVQPTLIDGLWHVFYPWGEGGHGIYETEAEMRAEYDLVVGARCPYGKPGDRLWVRETWGVVHEHGADLSDREQLDDARKSLPWASVAYRADANGSYVAEHVKRWRPSIFMQRRESRILLDVTSVRLERLHSISEEDATAEGIPEQPIGNLRAAMEMGFARYNFASLWDGINGKRAPWSSDPWVWVVSFRRTAS